MLFFPSSIFETDVFKNSLFSVRKPVENLRRSSRFRHRFVLKTGRFPAQSQQNHPPANPLAFSLFKAFLIQNFHCIYGVWQNKGSL
jgi:hypothetical protein